MAAQLSFTKVRSRRSLRLCSALAINSFPLRFHENQDRRRRGGDRLHFLQHAPKGLAVTHDLLKVVFRSGFPLGGTASPRSTCLESRDLLEGQGVFYRDGHLRADLGEFGVVLAKRILLHADHAERAEHLSVGNQQGQRHPDQTRPLWPV